MKQDSLSKIVLVTGAGGFTGIHLCSLLASQGCKVVPLISDLLDKEQLIVEINNIKPDFVIHLAAISFAAELNASLIYNVNVIGTLNLLDALSACNKVPSNVILASSATVYGDQSSSMLNEELCPAPINHYGCSKLTMEHLSKSYHQSFPLIIVRPFNYTGVGHAQNFVIPKIVNAYKNKEKIIELGNLDVYREYNDVRDICEIYIALLFGQGISSGLVCNICSGKTVSLQQVISYMNDIAGYQIDVKVNPAFVRPNEIKVLSGDASRLNSVVNYQYQYLLDDTLTWMYGALND